MQDNVDDMDVDRPQTSKASHSNPTSASNSPPISERTPSTDSNRNPTTNFFSSVHSSDPTPSNASNPSPSNASNPMPSNPSPTSPDDIARIVRETIAQFAQTSPPMTPSQTSRHRSRKSQLPKEGSKAHDRLLKQTTFASLDADKEKLWRVSNSSLAKLLWITFFLGYLSPPLSSFERDESSRQVRQLFSSE